MPLLTVLGTYRDGKVELAERPEGVGPTANVLVTFLASRAAPAEDRETLRRQAFEDMARGLNLGGPPYPGRNELYDRDER